MDNTQSYSEPIGDSFKYNQDYNRASDFLGIDKNQRESIKVAEKISYLVDWAYQQNKNTDVQGALLKINKLRKELGLNSQGELLLGQLFEFVRLKADIERKPSNTPYDEVMNDMIKTKNESKQNSKTESFIKSNKQTANQINHDSKQAELVAQKAIKDHVKSFIKPPSEPVKTQNLVDSTPIPSQYVGRSINHVQ